MSASPPSSSPPPSSTDAPTDESEELRLLRRLRRKLARQALTSSDTVSVFEQQQAGKALVEVLSAIRKAKPPAPPIAQGDSLVREDAEAVRTKLEQMRARSKAVPK